jgi:hypothetical protein
MQSTSFDFLTVTSGLLVTVMAACTVSVILQVLLVIKTWYVVLTVGAATVDGAVGFAMPVLGYHWYISPPDAVTVSVSPIQMSADAGLMAKIGCGLTVTKTLLLAEQRLPSVTLTKYFVVDVGFAVGLGTDVLLNPVEGDHK